jgi:hypothetical protein
MRTLAAALGGGIAALAIGLVGAPVALASGDLQSDLAPGLTLPYGAEEDKSGTAPDAEYWVTQDIYSAVVRTIGNQVPEGSSYNGLSWCHFRDTGNVGMYPTTSWSWGDAKGLLKITVADEKPTTVLIIREYGHDCNPDEHFC